MENKEENKMENKEMKKNAPEELDDNTLDHVSGGVNLGFENKVSVVCSNCKKYYFVLPIEATASYKCLNCKGTKLVELILP